MTLVQTGLASLRDEGFKSLSQLKVGLLAHGPSVDENVQHVSTLMKRAGVNLTKLFGPEHGFLGTAQDMEAVSGEAARLVDRETGAQVYSLYGSDEASLYPTDEMFADLDVLVVDLQDVGARYYTYAATMGYALRTAARVGLRVVVLDRPNPLGGLERDLEGGQILPGFYSFVGAFDMAIRHGMTIGEYAHYVTALEALDVELEVVPMQGWRREMDFEATGLPWVQPSPNMPTNDTAWIYPGQCLLEGTNLSEGRGTTRPFELCGAPYLDGAAWADAAGDHPGIAFRPLAFKPMFQKHARDHCGGVQLHVTDRAVVRSVALSVSLIIAARALAPEQFDWRRERYEFIEDRLAIDLLFGSDVPRAAIESGATTREVVDLLKPHQGFRDRRSVALMYEELA